MARRKTLLEIADELEPSVRDAFLESINRIVSDVQLGLLIEAIGAGDTDRVFRLLNLERAYFEPLVRGLTAAYQGAGDAILAGLVAEAGRNGYRVTAQFSTRNLRAETFLSTQSSRLITEVIEDQREAVRILLTEGARKGTAPRTAALNIVGRINRATGNREGGVIGLHSQDIARADRVRDILRTDPRSYFIKDRTTGRWKPRYKGTDRRFDRAVLRAIKEGRTVSAADTDRIVTRYRTRLLRDRGETIARTELLGSVHGAQEEGLRQMVDSGKLASENIIGEWDASGDSDTRDSHRNADGQTRPQGQPFDVGGYPMLYPGDQSFGAPADLVINCRCVRRLRIDWIAQAAMEERAA